MKKIIAITALTLLSSSAFSASLEVTITTPDNKVSNFSLPITKEPTFIISNTHQQVVTGFSEESESLGDDMVVVETTTTPVKDVVAWGTDIALAPRETEGLYEFSIGTTTKPELTEKTHPNGLKYTVVGIQSTQKFSTTIYANTDKEICTKPFSNHQGASTLCYKRVN